MSYYTPNQYRRRRMRRAPVRAGYSAYRAIADVAPVVASYAVSKYKQYKGKGIRGKKVMKTTSYTVPAKSKPYVSRAKKVKKQIAEINKKLNDNNSMLTIRRRDAFSYQVNSNQCSYNHYRVNSTNVMESNLTKMPYYDTSTQTLIDVDLTTDAYQRSVLFKNIYSNMTFRNNYRIPVNVRVYVCRVKGDTSLDPVNCIENGITNQQDNPQTLSTQLFPTDSEQFNDLWRIEKSMSCLLQPGSQKTITHGESDVSYDTSLTDSHPQQFQRVNKSFVFLVRLEGVPTHEANNIGLIGCSSGGIDVLVDSTYKIIYDGNTNGTSRFIYEDNSGGVPNAVVANKPVASNQTYSPDVGPVN